MPVESEDKDHERRTGTPEGASPGPSNGDGPRPGDFSTEPLYLAALRLCGVVLDLELKFPNDERAALYTGMRSCAIETGSIIASAFGRAEGPARGEYWEDARSRLMECRHYVLVAHMRYVLDSNDVEAFDQAYFELLVRLNVLLEAAVASAAVPAAEKG